MRRAEADSVGLLLPWYLNGTLSAEDRRRVEEHLPSCAECRALLDAGRELEGLGGDDVLGFLDHPEAQHLDDFAADPELLEPRLAGWIRDHVAQCSACGEAVEILEREIGRPAPVPGSLLRRTLLRPEAAGAYLVLLVATIPVIWLLVRSTETERRPLPPAGAVTPLVLGDALRGGTTVPVAHVAAGQPLVPVSAEFELPEDRRGGESFRFAIIDPSENRAWSVDVTGEAVERSLRSTGVVMVLVPADALTVGRHRLAITRSGDPTARPVLDASFDVEREALTAIPPSR